MIILVRGLIILSCHLPVCFTLSGTGLRQEQHSCIRGLGTMIRLDLCTEYYTGQKTKETRGEQG